MKEYQAYITTAIETCIREGWASAPGISDIYGCLQYMVTRSGKINVPRASVEINKELIHYRAFDLEELSKSLATLKKNHLVQESDGGFTFSDQFLRTTKNIEKSILQRFNSSLRKDASKIGQRISLHQRILRKFGFGEAPEDLQYVDDFKRAEQDYLDSFKKWT